MSIRSGAWAVTLAASASVTFAYAWCPKPRPAIYDAPQPITRAQLTLVGHDGQPVIDSLPIQHITRVSGLPERDKDGHIYSVYTAYGDFAPDEIKSWRLSFIDGRLVGKVFQISTNGANSVTVTDANGPLDSVAVGDQLLIDSVVVRGRPER